MGLFGFVRFVRWTLLQTKKKWFNKKKGFSTDRSYEFFLGINDGMTEGEYKFDNSPLQVAYTNFATDDLPNIEGVNEVVYKVKNWKH